MSDGQKSSVPVTDMPDPEVTPKRSGGASTLLISGGWERQHR